MSRRLLRAGGVFADLHRKVIGAAPELPALRPGDYPPALLREAQDVWHQRLISEFRSVQIMTRFLTEVVNAGDPLDVYAGALDLVRDEVRHTELCLAVCETLGGPTTLPAPVELRDPEAFLAASYGERALHTAISMLVINETLSTAFLEDLRARCGQPAIRRVLDLTLADEEHHHAYGWAYVTASLQRFPASTLPAWRTLVEQVLRPHRQVVHETLGGLSAEQRQLAAHPDIERVRLGLFSRARQALVLERALEELTIKLRGLGLIEALDSEPAHA